jgi:formylglycine-generating enzyme required for sulfatase activity
VKVFLCYRGSDLSGKAPLIAGKIVQRLKASYGQDSVILDPGLLPPGADVPSFMKGFVSRADVFVVLIGPQWAELMRRHAQDPQDLHRLQIEAALKADLPVMPVVIDTTPMPSPDELPASVARLAEQPRFRLSVESELSTQMGQLMHHIEAAAPKATVPIVNVAGPVRSVREDQPRTGKRVHTASIGWWWAIPFAAFLGFAFFKTFQGRFSEPPKRDASNDYLNSIGDRMIWCSPGKFRMGSPETETGRSQDETPHEVNLTRGFWIGAHEITQAQWKLVMGAFHKSYRKQFGTACPVTHVSWEDAVAFCEKLSAREGGVYQLPTEAQWEYACRAGTTGPYSTEGVAVGEFSWHVGNSKGHPHLVGEKVRNHWGLQDIHGNVFEWCSDWYAPYPNSAVTDPSGPGTGKTKVYRSGAFDMPAASHRSAFRGFLDPRQHASNLGFRVACLSKPNTVPTTRDRTTAQPPSLPSGSEGVREEEIAPDVKVRFIHCPPGKFTMGEGSSAREVTLTQGFWLAETEVSRAQWLGVMGQKSIPPGPNRGNRVPIDQVGWDDIQGRGGFLEKIQPKAPAGFAFALPTEAQWEYACRAGTTTKFWWGDEFLPGEANVANAPGTAEAGQVSFFQSKGLPTGASMTIKSLKANPWGFYDMAGNVWEWCQDWYEETPSGPTTDPQGPPNGDLKVLKGGAWNEPEPEARSAARLRYFPAFRGGNFGFRLALIPKP